MTKFKYTCKKCGWTGIEDTEKGVYPCAWVAWDETNEEACPICLENNPGEPDEAVYSLNCEIIK